MTEYVIHREDELRHFGVKGTHWGVRRYQNEDGSYKPGAEGRYYTSVKISGSKKNVSTNGGGTSVKAGASTKTARDAHIAKGAVIEEGKKKTTSSTQTSVKSSGGGGGVAKDNKTEETKNNPEATAPYEKKLANGQTITVYPTSMKKAQSDKGSKSSSGSSSSTKKDQEKKEGNSKFKLSQFTDKIDNLFGNIDEMDWEDLELDSSDEDSIDELITQYREWRGGNSSKTSQTKKIDAFIERYQAWKSNNKKAWHGDMEETYLQHFGILGMKWGIRRYQNEDGSYTAEGKRRKSKGKNYSEDYWNAHDKKKVEYMSDKELQKRLNRLNNEKNYKSATSRQPSEIEKRNKQFFDAAFNQLVIGLTVGVAAELGKEYIKKKLKS